MIDPIRILHFADIHIGVESYGRTDPETGLSSRVVDFLHRLDEMISYATEHDVDLIIFAGDAFKTRAPSPTFQREFAHRVRDLANLAPIVLLVGNHDVPPTVMKASSIEIYDTLAVPNVYVAADYETRIIETKRGHVAVGTAPYPMRSRVLEHIPTMGMTIAQTDNILQEELTKILDTLAEEADRLASEIGEDVPRILAGHFTVGGAVVSSERGIMLGRDVTVPKMILADNRWDYVALGHIHKFQNLTDGRNDAPPIVYSGSMERIDFGEEGDPKGFCWIDLSRKTTQWRFVEVGARPFITLKIDLRNEVNPTEKVIRVIEQYHLRDAVVRVNLDFTQESESRFNELAVRDALRRAGTFFIAAIRKDVEQAARARLGTSPEGLTHLELLERYLISREIELDRRTELLEEANSIFDEVKEHITNLSSAQS